GVLALKGDGNSISEVSRLAEQALEHIKLGNGPCLLELTTYRFREHCGPDADPYQPAEEVTYWKTRDPLFGIAESRVEIESEIEEAFIFAEASPFPTSDTMYPCVKKR